MMVHVFADRTKVAVHIRSYKAGGYTTNKEHLCSHHKHYQERSPDYYLKRGEKQSLDLYRLMEALFLQPDKHPEQLYRTCDGLLNLAGKYDKEFFEKACRTALDNGIYSYMFIRNFLANKMGHADEGKPPKPLPGHSNIRGKDYYAQLEIHFSHPK